ncbi:MAG: hypothetical protein WCR74_05120 [Betaproteobacteria bacterium]
MNARFLPQVMLFACALMADGAALAADSRDFRGHFPDYPGFSGYFAANPPSPALPDGAEQVLLVRYKPRFLLPRDHPGMIDFYGDYIAHGRLYNAEGKQLADKVTREVLNAHRNEPGAVFVHEAQNAKAPTPVVYGRIDRDVVDFGNGVKRRFTFLRYHAVFRQSGLPASLTGWRAFLLSLTGDLEDWRQLDNHTAATVVLDEEDRPVALMLQPHSYMRTYVFGVDVALPADGRTMIDVAIRSNELYRHVEGRVSYRAVRFLGEEGMRYMLGGEARPTLSADDITDSVRETDYSLQFLAPADAFYTFKGHLGQKRSMTGREGPPGADYHTLPELKPLAMQMTAGYWHRDHAGDRERFEATYGKTGDLRDFARAQLPQLAAALAAAREKQSRTTPAAAKK